MKAQPTSTYDLGQKVRYYRPDWINIIPHFLIAESFAIFISILCFAPLLILVDNQPKAIQELCGLFFFLVIGITTIFIAVRSIINVSLYQHGLVYKWH